MNDNIQHSIEFLALCEMEKSLYNAGDFRSNILKEFIDLLYTEQIIDDRFKETKLTYS